MKEFIINENEAGQRFDKYLGKLLREAPKSFFYKMLRKKNITINGKKAEGNEILKLNDTVRLFLSDETIQKFSGTIQQSPGDPDWILAHAGKELSIIYEDESTIFLNKPAGMLSQKAKPDDISMVEHLIAYLLNSGQISKEELRTFHPSVCNRLDRNTSGLVLCGISLKGSQILSRMIHDRTVHKYYAAVVKGRVDKAGILGGVLEKDEIANKVTIKDVGEGKEVRTIYEPAAYADGLTLLSIELVTGKTHQIRAHMAGIGHPLLGDAKYGDRSFNEAYRKKGVKSQLLHAQRMVFPTLRELPEEEAKKAKDLAFLGKTIEAPLPEVFHRVGF